MAIPILQTWPEYFKNPHEGMGSSYERIVLNLLLSDIKEKYDIKNVLEVPVFGFTGLTGINSFELYLKGCRLAVVDHNQSRVDEIQKLYYNLNANIHAIAVDSYSKLPFLDSEFDFSWNFSALWFIDNLQEFLKELSRITSKAILICVPNQNGLGYKWQKANAEIPKGIVFKESNINPEIIQYEMKRLGWGKAGEAYIDCPPWPDIGMSKEKFLGKYIGIFKTSAKDKAHRKSVSILDYYKGIDLGFPEKMLKYDVLEKYAPVAFKRFWSHHLWMLFDKLS